MGLVGAGGTTTQAVRLFLSYKRRTSVTWWVGSGGELPMGLEELGHTGVDSLLNLSELLGERFHQGRTLLWHQGLHATRSPMKK